LRKGGTTPFFLDKKEDDEFQLRMHAVYQGAPTLSLKGVLRPTRPSQKNNREGRVLLPSSLGL